MSDFLQVDTALSAMFAKTIGRFAHAGIHSFHDRILRSRRDTIVFRFVDTSIPFLDGGRRCHPSYVRCWTSDLGSADYVCPGI